MNGENTAPVYKFLKSGKWGIIGDDIQWNFAKFLVDKDGQAVDRYYPTTSPLTIEVKPNLQFMFDSQSSVGLCCLIVLLYQKIIFILSKWCNSSCFVTLLQHDIKKLLGVSEWILFGRGHPKFEAFDMNLAFVFVTLCFCVCAPYWLVRFV